METITRREKYLANVAAGENIIKGTSNTWKSVSTRSTMTPIVTKTYNDLGLVGGEYITFSVDLRTNSGKKLRARIEYYISEEKRVSDYSAKYIEESEGRLTVTGQVRPGYEKVELCIDANLTAATHTGYTVEEYKCVKLEIGRIATPWTPAPEDVTVPPPITRAERYLHYICKGGDESKLPLPITREEKYLNYLARMGVDNVVAGKNMLTNSASASATDLSKEKEGVDWIDGKWGDWSYGNGKIESIEISDCPDNDIKRGWRISGNTTGNKDVSQRNLPMVYGETYTVSCYARAISENPTLYVRVRNTNTNTLTDIAVISKAITNEDWQRFSETFIYSGAERNTVQFGSSGSNGDIEICGMKLEKGATATKWTPNPFDLGISIPNPITIDERLWYGICGYGTELKNLSAGGENLVLQSGIEYSNSNYPTHIYDLSEDIDPNETYTITIWGELGEGKIAFRAFIGGGYNKFPLSEEIATGEYQVTGQLEISPGHENDRKDKLYVYALPNSVTGVTSTIHRVKVEKGTVGTDWTPAPSDPGAIRIVTREQQLLWRIYSGITERRKAASAAASTTASDEQIDGPEYEEEQADVVEPQEPGLFTEGE